MKPIDQFECGEYKLFLHGNSGRFAYTVLKQGRLVKCDSYFCDDLVDALIWFHGLSAKDIDTIERTGKL